MLDCLPFYHHLRSTTVLKNSSVLLLPRHPVERKLCWSVFEVSQSCDVNKHSSAPSTSSDLARASDLSNFPRHCARHESSYQDRAQTGTRSFPSGDTKCKITTCGKMASFEWAEVRPHEEIFHTTRNQRLSSSLIEKGCLPGSSASFIRLMKEQIIQGISRGN